MKVTCEYCESVVDAEKNDLPQLRRAAGGQPKGKGGRAARGSEEKRSL